MRRLLALIVLLFAASAFGDVIHLKDGTKVEGKVVSRHDRIVRFRTTAGRLRTFQMKNVERIEVDGEKAPEDAAAKAAPAAVSEAELQARDKTKAYERKLGFKLKTSVKPHVIVRGDHPQEELDQVADKAELTVLHFLDTFECDASDVLRESRRYRGGSIEVFRFRLEKGYRRFMDKVFDGMRDETVNAARFGLMKRQRGFWNLSPQPLIGGYQGPSPLDRTVAAVSHNTSHVMLMLYEQRGSWMPWWFLEGFATFQEIQITGDNLTYCMDLTQGGDYVHEKGKDADETAKSRTEKRWRARVKKMIADHTVKDLRVLGKLKLNELNLPEVIQSWSVVTWIHGQGKLRPFTQAYKRTDDLDLAFKDTFDFGVEAAFEKWKTWAK